MPAATRNKADTGSAYLAAARYFEQLAKFFASPKASRASGLTTKQMEASLKLFKKAPPEELVEVSALLNVIIAELEKIEPRGESNAGAKGGGRE